jgi:hypothetical protein
LPVVSMNQLPVRSNGGFGRRLARFDGASALSGVSGGAAWVPLARAGVCADVGAPSTHATRQAMTAAILTCIRLPKALITTEHTEHTAVKHWDFLGGPGDLGG